MKLKKIVLPVLCAGLIGTLGTACSKDDDKKQVIVNTNSIQEAAGDLTESAEKLALAGEQLVSPISFMYADLIFDMALVANPENKRAQFFKALIKPMMAMKGAMSRVKPVVKTLSDEQQKEYNEFIAKAPESALKTFLMDGPEDIKTEEDALKFMDGYRSAWEDIRVFMKENKDLNLDVNIMTLAGAAAALDSASKECKAENPSDGVFAVDAKCDYLKALKVNISRADTEVIQQVAAGMQIYHILATSYSLDGVRDYAESNQENDVSAEEVIKHFSENTTAGKLRHNGLAKITKMGVDAISGTRWALSMKNEICPEGKTSKRNRKGFLVRDGICIKEVNSKGKPTEDLLKTIEAALTGGTIAIEGKDDMGNKVAETVIRPSAPLDNPIQDLRSVAPTSYNDECGSPVALADNTIGGLFPNKDANSYLKAVGSLDDKECE